MSKGNRAIYVLDGLSSGKHLPSRRHPHNGERPGENLRNIVGRGDTFGEFGVEDKFRLLAGKYWLRPDEDDRDTYPEDYATFFKKDNNENHSMRLPFSMSFGEVQIIESTNPFLTTRQVVTLTSDDPDFVDYAAGSPAGPFGSSRSYPGSIVEEEKIYTDCVFEVNTPIDHKIVEKLGDPGNVMSAQLTPQYNFYVEEYENVTSGGNSTNVPETLLPNMYAFITNSLIGHPNLKLSDHLSLGGRDSLDGYGTLISAKGSRNNLTDKRVYFKNWATEISAIAEENGNTNTISQPFGNIGVTSEDYEIVKNHVEKRQLFPMYFELLFSTNDKFLGDVEFDSILVDTELSAELMQEVIIESDPNPNVRSLYVSDMNFLEKNEKRDFGGSTPGVSYRSEDLVGRKDTISTSTRKAWDLTSWWSAIGSMVNADGSHSDALQGDGMQASFNGVPSRYYTDVASTFLSKEKTKSEDPQERFFKNFQKALLAGKLKTLTSQNLRSYNDLMAGEPAWSETAFFKIEKWSVSPDDQPLTKLQSYFFSNDGSSPMKIIDTQVKYDTRYIYNIVAYRVVVGNRYLYRNARMHGRGTFKFDVINTPFLKLVEVPYYQTRPRHIVDHPPITPDVDIIPYYGVNNKILLSLNASTGNQRILPIIMEDGDQNIFDKIRASQEKEQLEPLLFKSDDTVAYLDIFRLEKKPRNYTDFMGNRLVSIATGFASSATYQDDIEPNRKYYYAFRCTDIHGHVSNPTQLWEVEIIDENHTIYPIIRVIDFETEKVGTNTKPFRKYIQIVPNVSQTVLNEGASGIGPDAETVAGISGVYLGNAEEGIWGKKFKIRLISKNSGRKIDFNIKFKNTFKGTLPANRSFNNPYHHDDTNNS